MADPARPESEFGRHADSRAVDTAAQNAAASCWSQESSHTWARNAIERGADPNIVLNAALHQDIYRTSASGGLFVAGQSGGETGAKDHRPATERMAQTSSSETGAPRADWYANHGEKQAPTTRPDGAHSNDRPTVKNAEDLKTARTEIDQSMGSMSQAVGDIMRGDYEAAMRDLKGSVQKIDSGEEDLKSAFGGAIPGKDSFTHAQERIQKAIERLQQGKYEDSITTIGTALTDMRKGRSDVQEASQPPRSGARR